MTTYQYAPLKDGEIRLTSVLPADALSDPLRISIEHVRLPPSCFGSQHHDLAEHLASFGLSDTDKPDYVALSYVWGWPPDPKLAYVDAAPETASTVSITNNLDVALRHLRFKTKPLVLWIDAICINQGDLEERGFQVSLMDSIYSSAKGVIVWLGPEEHGSHQVMERLAWLGERVIPQDDGSLQPNPTGPPLGPDEASWLSLTEALPGDEAQTHDLVVFFERPWFRRLWIRQEIALAQQAVVVCGQTRLPWEPFQNAADCCVRKPLPQGADWSQRDLIHRFVQIREAIMNICEIFNFATPYSYRILRWDHQGIKFTDPRDTIYAVKSILDPEDVALDVQPDYRLKTAEVFENVCLRILERQRLTYFLYSCELATTVTPNLPSWVPDWAQPPGARRLDTNWSACGFLSAQGSYLGGGVLRVAGVEVDEIDVVKGRWPGRPWNFVDFIDVVWSCYPGADYVDCVYREGETYADAYCRAFMMEKFRQVFLPPKKDGETIKLDYSEARRAVSKIWALEQDWDDYESLRKDPDVLALFYHAGHWKSRCFFITKEGWLGMAPEGTQPGDVVSVILGCQFPLVLRRQDDDHRWKVVGACHAHGFMSGQAIYGEEASRAYRQVELQDKDRDRYVDGEYAGLQEISTGVVRTDPAEVLVETLGVQPSVWTRKPHRLEVPADELRAAGVKLRDFDLV